MGTGYPPFPLTPTPMKGADEMGMTLQVTLLSFSGELGRGLAAPTPQAHSESVHA